MSVDVGTVSATRGQQTHVYLYFTVDALYKPKYLYLVHSCLEHRNIRLEQLELQSEQQKRNSVTTSAHAQFVDVNMWVCVYLPEVR